MSIKFNGDSKCNGRPIRVYDNFGKTADRYTVVYMDMRERCAPKMFTCLGMNDEPFHPQGICQHSAAMVGRHLGRRIPFQSLPEDCQKAVKRDLEVQS